MFKLDLPDGDVILDFYADWCPPCKQMEPTMKALEDEGFTVIKINVDDRPMVASEYGVMSIPTFIGFRDKEQLGTAVGAQSRDQLVEKLRLNELDSNS